MKLFLFIIGSVLLALFVLAIILGLTDIRRYIRISRM